MFTRQWLSSLAGDNALAKLICWKSKPEEDYIAVESTEFIELRTASMRKTFLLMQAALPHPRQCRQKTCAVPFTLKEGSLWHTSISNKEVIKDVLPFCRAEKSSEGNLPISQGAFQGWSV